MDYRVVMMEGGEEDLDRFVARLWGIKYDDVKLISDVYWQQPIGI